MNAASDLFSRYGYTQSTMQMIADNAHIGVATVFRAFGTKGSILASIVKRDLIQIFDEAWKVIRNPLPKLDDSVVALVECMLGILDKPSKSIRIPSHFWSAVVAGKPEIDAVVRWADEVAQIEIYALLFEFERRAGRKLGFDLEDMTMNIFYIFNGHYISYISEDGSDHEKFAADLRRRLRMIAPPISVTARST